MVKGKNVLSFGLGCPELKFKAFCFFLQLSHEFKHFSARFHAPTLCFIWYFFCFHKAISFCICFREGILLFVLAVSHSGPHFKWVSRCPLLQAHGEFASFAKDKAGFSPPQAMTRGSRPPTEALHTAVSQLKLAYSPYFICCKWTCCICSVGREDGAEQHSAFSIQKFDSSIQLLFWCNMNIY